MIIKRAKFDFWVLTTMLYLVLLRATNIGFGYPTAENQLAQITFFPQKIMQFMVVLLLFLYFVFSIKNIFSKFKINFLSGLIIGCILISIVFSSHTMLAFRNFISVAILMMPIYLYFIKYGSECLFESLVKFIFVIVIFNVIYMFLFPQYGKMTGIHFGAWRGMFIHKNGSGPFFGMISVIFIHYFYNSSLNIKIRFLSLFAFFSALTFVVMSKSATAIIICIITLSTYFFSLFIFSIDKIGKRKALLSLFFGFIVIVIFMFNVYYEDVLLLLDKDPTLTGRTELWDVLLQLSFKHPFFGYGFGVFTRPEIMYQYSIEFGWEAKSTHSSYIDLILGMGYIGFVTVFFTIFLYLIKIYLTQTDTSISSSVLAICASVIVGGLIDSTAASGDILGLTIIWPLLFIFLLIPKYRY
jgi:exopolysaccharide production protein ExoQ